MSSKGVDILAQGAEAQILHDEGVLSLLLSVAMTPSTRFQISHGNFQFTAPRALFDALVKDEKLPSFLVTAYRKALAREAADLNEQHGAHEAVVPGYVTTRVRVNREIK